MSYLVHCYIEVEDEKDQSDLADLLQTHEYPIAYGDAEGLPETVDEFESMQRRMEEELLRSDEDLV